ncbi:MAG: type II CAAX endopeptidase family protein [Acidobacteriia bacterium]|nr:type II CAAX endopeptidase family protein [Terriglobia bacterium]
MTNTGHSPVPARDTAALLRGFGPLGVLAIVVIFGGALVSPIVSAPLVLLWAWISRTSWPDLGFTKSRSWALTVVGGVAFGIALKLAMKALVMPLLGAPAINERYHYLAGNTAALPSFVLMVLISAGLGEEVFFRSYIFERLGKLLGRGTWALTCMVVISAGFFAIAHYPNQRLPGVEQAAVVGVIFGGIFAWRRNIWVLMVTHAAFDLTAIALIYWNWEEPVAHALFR